MARFYKEEQERKKQIKEEQRRMIYALAYLLESRDDAIGNHLENVGRDCKLLAQNLQMDDDNKQYQLPY